MTLAALMGAAMRSVQATRVSILSAACGQGLTAPRRGDLGAVRLELLAYGGGMRGVPWWGVVFSAAAPVLLVGGWTVAASLQPRFDTVADTVSALAAPGAADRWVVTLTFVVVGVCYLVTALALRPAGTAGRLILIIGAVAGMLVAANPERAGDAYPWGYIIWASIGLAGVTAWPAGAWRRGSAVPWSLRPAATAVAVAVMLALVIWFAAELITGSGQAGLAERAAGIAQALWPMAVVLSCRHPVTAASDPLPEPAAWSAGPGTRPGLELGLSAQSRRYLGEPVVWTPSLLRPELVFLCGDDGRPPSPANPPADAIKPPADLPSLVTAAGWALTSWLDSIGRDAGRRQLPALLAARAGRPLATRS